MVYLTQSQFDNALRQGIYTLLSKDAANVYTVKYWCLSLREEFNKIQKVTIRDNKNF